MQRSREEAKSQHQRPQQADENSSRRLRKPGDLPLRASTQSVCSLFFPECSAAAVADLLFLVDGSWSVGRANFKHIRSFLSATASAFQIGRDRTRVGVVQYGSDARVEFGLDAHLSRPALLKAIGALPYKGGDTLTGKVASLGSERLKTGSLTHFPGSQDTPWTSSCRTPSPKRPVPAKTSPRCWWW